MTELRAYDEEATQLQKQLHEIPADIECQKLSTALTGIHTRITSLLDQAEQGRIALEQARATREKRVQEIHTYKLFLEETDAWLKNVVSKLHEQCSINTSKVCFQCKLLLEDIYFLRSLYICYFGLLHFIFNNFKNLEGQLNLIYLSFKKVKRKKINVLISNDKLAIFSIKLNVLKCLNLC